MGYLPMSCLLMTRRLFGLKFGVAAGVLWPGRLPWLGWLPG